MTSKKDLSERDICTQFIVPALKKAGWDIERQVREEVYFTDGRIFVKGSKTVRGERKRADFILYHRPNIPIAVIEGDQHGARRQRDALLDCLDQHAGGNRSVLPVV